MNDKRHPRDMRNKLRCCSYHSSQDEETIRVQEDKARQLQEAQERLKQRRDRVRRT